MPRSIEIPTAPTRNPKSEKFVTTLGDTEQSTKRPKRQEEEIPRECQPASSSSGTATDSSMVIPDPQIPKLARRLSPTVREDIIQKRQRPAEVNTVLTIAGGDSRIEISTLTDDQNALHTANVNELLNMDTFGVVASLRRGRSLHTVQCPSDEHSANYPTSPMKKERKSSNQLQPLYNQPYPSCKSGRPASIRSIQVTSQVPDIQGDRPLTSFLRDDPFLHVRSCGVGSTHQHAFLRCRLLPNHPYTSYTREDKEP